jgi:CubicO group peptidase (beta-lactamase class C family)
MASMSPTTGFGETFQYSNPMVMAGGLLAAHAVHPRLPLGKAYDTAMQELVFRPLGMRDTTFDYAVVARRDHARPHGRDVTLAVRALPISAESAIISVRPAGGAWSSARDMARYLVLELARGKTPDGEQLVSEAALLERRKPQVKVDDDTSYGLGLFVEEYQGLPMVHHGGNTLGFTSDLFLFPEHGLGAVVLSNAAGANALRGAIKRRLIEILYDAPEEARTNLEFALARQKEVTERELKKVTLAPDAAWLESIAGDYREEGLGLVRVRRQGKRGVLDAGEWRSALGKFVENDGTVMAMLLDPPLAGFTAIVGDRDGRRTLTINTGQKQYVLERVSPRSR